MGQIVELEGEDQGPTAGSWQAWCDMAEALMATSRASRRHGHGSAAHVAAMEAYGVAWRRYQEAASAATARAFRVAGY